MIILRFDDYVVTEYTVIQKRGGGLGGWGSEGEARRVELGGEGWEGRTGRGRLGGGGWEGGAESGGWKVG